MDKRLGEMRVEVEERLRMEMEERLDRELALLRRELLALRNRCHGSQDARPG